MRRTILILRASRWSSRLFPFSPPADAAGARTSGIPPKSGTKTAVREPSWHDWSDSLRLLQPESANPKRALSMKAPDFPYASIQSTMDVLPGVIYRVGGTPLVEPDRGRRLFFAFLTVEVTNPKPTVSLNLPTPKFSEKNRE